jgi:hypothetical protein
MLGIKVKKLEGIWGPYKNKNLIIDTLLFIIERLENGECDGYQKKG